MEFLDKKQRVYDLVLSQYGKHLLAKGELKPEYYAFFDDNILYDKRYVNPDASESQNDIYNRIKDETHYFATNLNFAPALSGAVVAGGLLKEYQHKEDYSIFSSDSYIGDSVYTGDSQKAPAWNVLALEGAFDSFNTDYNSLNYNIPQIEVKTTLKIVSADPGKAILTNNYRRIDNSTRRFADDRVLSFDVVENLFYFEELNTENLKDNFDVEMYLFTGDSSSDKNLKRLKFADSQTNVLDGFIVEKPPIEDIEITEENVEFYFDLIKDKNIDTKTICKNIGQLNKENINLNLEYDCSMFDNSDVVFYDIYGREVEGQKCLE